jgi:hypothetical protein
LTGCSLCRCLAEVWNCVHVDISSGTRIGSARGSATREATLRCDEPVQLQLWVRMFCLQSRRSARCRTGPWTFCKLRDDGIVPLICPTCQNVFVGFAQGIHASDHHATLHGVVFDILVESESRVGLAAVFPVDDRRMACRALAREPRVRLRPEASVPSVHAFASRKLPRTRFAPDRRRLAAPRVARQGEAWWGKKDSNLRSHKTADLQSAPFATRDTPPLNPITGPSAEMATDKAMDDAKTGHRWRAPGRAVYGGIAPAKSTNAGR